MIRALVLALLVSACAPSATAPTAVPSARIATTSPSASATPTASPTPAPSVSAIPSATASATATPGLMPIVDAHMHYSAEAWNAYPPARVAALMDAAGVRTALVSSAPDRGTLDLRAALGGRIVPLIGPYRGPSDVSGWTRDGTVIPYLDSSYKSGVHKGFGEFHLSPGQVGLPVVQAALRFARRNDLFLQVHTDAVALEQLLNDPIVGPDYVVLWAHAGVTATPEQITAVLARWPRLSVELSLRDDIAPGGSIDPRWATLFLAYPDRFMVGTDTWSVGVPNANERWDRYAQIVAGIRVWLAQVRPDVAEKLAHANAERFLAQFR